MQGSRKKRRVRRLAHGSECARSGSRAEELVTAAGLDGQRRLLQRQLLDVDVRLFGPIGSLENRRRQTLILVEVAGEPRARLVQQLDDHRAQEKLVRVVGSVFRYG